MARPKSPDYEAQRTRMLALATDVIAEQGYARASMSDLAQACSTSKAGLYHYFTSKEAILFESLDRYTRRLADRLNAVRLRELAAQDELEAMVRTLMLEYRDSRSHHIALLNDVKFLNDVQRAQIVQQERAVVDRVAECLARIDPQRFEGERRTPTTMALLSMLNFTFAWLKPDGPMSYEQYADLVIGLWRHGLAHD
jgi:AcrR family transcriptional regulator